MRNEARDSQRGPPLACDSGVTHKREMGEGTYSQDRQNCGEAGRGGKERASLADVDRDCAHARRDEDAPEHARPELAAEDLEVHRGAALSSLGLSEGEALVDVLDLEVADLDRGVEDGEDGGTGCRSDVSRGTEGGRGGRGGGRRQKEEEEGRSAPKEMRKG